MKCEKCQDTGEIYVDFTQPGDDVLQYFTGGSANVVCDCQHTKEKFED